MESALDKEARVGRPSVTRLSVYVHSAAVCCPHNRVICFKFEIYMHATRKTSPRRPTLAVTHQACNRIAVSATHTKVSKYNITPMRFLSAILVLRDKYYLLHKLAFSSLLIPEVSAAFIIHAGDSSTLYSVLI